MPFDNGNMFRLCLACRLWQLVTSVRVVNEGRRQALVSLPVTDDPHDPLSMNCQDLAPLDVTASKGDCFCCVDGIQSAQQARTWSYSTEVILRSCLKVAGKDLDLTEEQCAIICDRQVFCASEMQQRYRLSMYSKGFHCLGKNHRVSKSMDSTAVSKMFFGGYNKVMKGLGKNAVCTPDAVSNSLIVSHKYTIERMRQEAETYDDCPALWVMPHSLDTDDCLCCSSPDVANMTHWSQHRDEVSKCLFAFRSRARPDLSDLTSRDCFVYCGAHAPGTCKSKSRGRYYSPVSLEKHHCLGKKEGVMRKSCSVDRWYKKMARTMNTTVSKMHKEVGRDKPRHKPPPPKATTSTPAKVSSRKKSTRSKKKESGRATDKPEDKSPKSSEKEKTDHATNETKPVVGHLTRLTRYGKITDERTFPLVFARTQKMTVRVSGGLRIASPFEHVCGGARGSRDEAEGADGPTQYISFSNAGQFPEVAEDCNQPWDIGQRRIKTSEESILKQGGFVIDISTNETAYKWCYEGGEIKTKSGKVFKFQGARDIEPWPYKCAHRAMQIKIKKSKGVPTSDWWTTENRKLIAHSCKVWATRASEVLILPDPDRIKKGDRKNAVTVSTDRDQGSRMCVGGFDDRCTTFDIETKETWCCSDWPDSRCDKKFLR